VLVSEPPLLWSLIDDIPSDARGERERAEFLVTKLASLPIPRVARFQRELLDCMDDLLNWRLWEAADVIHPIPCSGDAFADFRLWVIALGSQKCQEIVRNPDALASIEDIVRIARLKGEDWVDSDYPHFPSLISVADDAFETIVSKFRPELQRTIDRPAVLDEQVRFYLPEEFPADYGVDTAVHSRLPRLSALRGWL
jgi:hypothetical protein